jgi:Raf kinase inhibitor-like YbhB/YbcL family protein
MEMTLTSQAFRYGNPIPAKYTCDGDGVNPHLVIHAVPEAARSLALVMDDPDAPNGLWVHWVLWDIPPETAEIREHTVPFGAEQGLNSWGNRSYGGPCPPSGEHRYFFRLYALDSRLRLPVETTKDDLERSMEGHILATAELMGTYASGR